MKYPEESIYQCMNEEKNHEIANNRREINGKKSIMKQRKTDENRNVGKKDIRYPTIE